MDVFNICGLLLVLGLSMVCPTEQNAEPNNSTIIGSWITQGETNAQGVPMTSFNLHVIEANQKITGEYCYISNYGNRIDCDNAFTGKKIADNHYLIQFNSQFGGVNGRATLQLKQQKLYWTLRQAPQQGDYSIAQTAVLSKEGV